MSDDQDLNVTPGHVGAGARLRAAREAIGLSRADIAARTKIAERHLIQIEDGNFSALASRAYAIGFSRTYAKAVGIDQAEIVSAVAAELDMAQPEPDERMLAVFEPGDPARGPSRGTAWLAALAAFVVILAGFALWRTYYVPAMSLPSLVSDEDAAEPVGAASVTAPEAAPQGQVTLTATQPTVWIKVYDAAGTQLFQKELALGESYAVPADANGPLLWTSRPDALTVRIGDKVLPPLAERQMMMKDVPVSASALLARAATQPAAAAASPATAVTRPVAAARAPAPRPSPRAQRTQAARPAEGQGQAAAPSAAPESAAAAPEPAATSTVSE